MKKFDYTPSCFCAYRDSSTSSGGGGINFLVATHAKLLFVHEDVRVKWAAQLEHVPVQLAVAKIDDTLGMIVSLSEEGRLKCSYLGTEPAFLQPIFLKQDTGSRGFNFDQAENEYRLLQTQIKSSIMSTGAILTPGSKQGKSAGSLLIDVDVPKQLDAIGKASISRDTELQDPLDAMPTLTCSLTFRAIENVSNVKVAVSACLPLCAVPDTFTFASVGSVSVTQEVTFYMKTQHVPASLSVTVCASYLHSGSGASRVSQTTLRLPLKMVMKAGQQNSMATASSSSQDDKGVDRKSGGANRYMC